MKNLKNILVVVGLLIVSGVFLTGCSVSSGRVSLTAKAGFTKAESLLSTVHTEKSDADGNTSSMTLGGIGNDHQYRGGKDPLR